MTCITESTRDAYIAAARATRQLIDWTRLLDPSAQWKWRENVRNISIYTRHEAPSAGSFSVLATGLIKGSVHEIAALMASSTQQAYCETMAAFHGKDFLRGTYTTDIAQDEKGEARASRLSLRSATFAGSGWRRRDEEWCFLDETALDEEGGGFVKLLTALAPDDDLVVHGGQEKTSRAAASSYENVICAYRVLAEETHASDPDTSSNSVRGACARIHFYAEITPPLSSTASHGLPKPSKKQEASTKVIQSRLLSLARNCDRLSLLVRRRRLGVQVLIDARRGLSLTNRQCVNCMKTQLLAKLCRLCGHGVCSDCSDTYERETRQSRTSKARIEKIRVCDPCLARIERADYSNVSSGSLTGPAVSSNPASPDSFDQPASSNLKSLLHEALRNAPSPQRKDAVRSVIQCVLDQENARLRTTSSVGSMVSTTSSTTDDCIAALDGLTLDSVRRTAPKLAGQQGRSYLLNPHDETEFPVPQNEAQRLQAIDTSGVLSHSGDWDELDIICDLAAKEIGAYASIVSIITHDQQRVVAANSPQFRAMHTSRATSFCSHTIMEKKPLIVPHPEADFRLSHIARSWNVGVRFYCGFPLLGEDDETVIGTLCCVDKQSHELTESQFSAMERLAQTATKIIRMENRRRRGIAETSGSR